MKATKRGKRSRTPAAERILHTASEMFYRDGIRAAVLEQKRWMRGYLAKLCSDAGAGDPEDLAERLLVLHEGATVVYSLGVSTEAVRKARQIAVGLVANLQE